MPCRFAIVAMLFIAMVNTDCVAQNVIPRFESIGVNEGLSQSSVYSIFQDKQGFMWFGTADGLNRYDGHNIEVYKRHITTVANSNFIRGNICEDANSNIWFCNETGIFCYNRQQDTLEIKLSFHKYNQAAGTFIDAENNFWIIHAITGIGVYNISNGSYRHIPLSFKINLQAFVWMHFMVDNSGNILFRIQRKDGVYRFNTKTLQYSHVLTGNNVYTMWMDGNNYCFVSDGKLIITDILLRQKEVIAFAAGKEIRDVTPDAYGRLWIATLDSGLVSYNTKTKQFTNYQHSNARLKSLPFDLSTRLYIDRSDNLWIGSDGGGVSKLDLKPPRFNLLPLNEGDYPFLKDYFTRCFYEDEQRMIWFGTHNSGLNKFNPENGNIDHYEYEKDKPGMLPGNNISTLFKDRDRNLWVCGCKGVSIFNEEKKVFKTVPIMGLSEPLNPYDVFVYSMTQLKNGDIIAATLLGLFRFKKEQNQYKGYPFSQPSLNGTMTSIVEMNDGSLWVSAPLNGLKHLKVKGQDFIEMEMLFKGMDLRSLHKDEIDSNILWVCSGNGLIRFNTTNKQYKIYDERDGMANSYAYGILEDGNHDFWISTNKGLIFFNRQANVFQNYTVNDGLQSNEFNTAAFYKGASGTFYFGGVKGFNWFTTLAAPRSAVQPGVAITSVEINDQPYHAEAAFKNQSTITLPYNNNSIAFHFAVLDFTRPPANKIQYQLSGWDKAPITSSDMNVQYANLSPGNYSLKYKSANSSGKWSAEQLLSITIKAPYWKTGWFYILLAAMVIAAVILVTRRIAQQKLKQKILTLERRYEMDNERQRIGREMHDDIGAGLTQISLMSEAAKRNNTPVNQLDEISVTSRQLVASISEIIWSMNAENNSLGHLFSYMREQLHKLLEHAGVKYTIDFTTNTEDCILTNEQRRNILLTTKEIVHNAVKHSKSGLISVTATINNCYLTVRIDDDGIGFNTGDVFSGNGLRNINKRMEQMGAVLHVTSLINKGSSFTYSLLLNSHLKPAKH